jgi:O-antigen ligase
MQVAGHKQRPPLHPQEKWFLGFVLLQLVFMPWAFGTMHLWSQITSLSVAAFGFVLSIWPRTYDPDHAVGISISSRSTPQGVGCIAIGDSNSGFRSPVLGFRLSPLPRLLKFPLFWVGLLLLCLLALQAWNPSWIWTRNATSWWLVRVNDTEWLPTSIQTPFERFNLWRQFIIYATVWLTACALWVGITRRKSLHILLGILVGNACVLGMQGFVHRSGGEAKVLWLREFPGASSFASFVYQNHAGAYFGMLSFVALGLAIWHFFEGRKRLARSTPAALWLIAALILVFAVIFSMSRGAIISVSLFGLAALLAVVILRFTSSTQSTVPTIVPILIALSVIGTVAWMIRQINFSSVYHRFEQLSKLQANDPSLVSRQMARESSMTMFGDHWVRGVGAGGFRYLFPEYIKEKQLIYDRGQLFWEHAHNDWLEIPIELGMTGVLLLVTGFGWIAWTWARNGGWRHPLVLMLAFGTGQVMVHALMDFPFQNPAILTTWLALWVIGLRWLELDAPAR